jgi:hypothetical protein
MSERLTDGEFLAIFGHTPMAARWVASADSEEYLALVTYLVQSRGFGNELRR